MDEKEAEARPVMGTILLVTNWASEASPTLGCSIEISRDIYNVGMSYVCRMSVVCQNNCVGGITCGPRACSKSFFWRLNQ